MTNESNASELPESVPTKISETISYIEQQFADCHDLTIKQWSFGPELKYSACSIFLDTMSVGYDQTYMKSTVEDLSPILAGTDSNLTPEKIAEFLDSDGISRHTPRILTSMEQIVFHLTDGNVIILIEGWEHAVSYQTASVQTRAVSEPTMEPVVFGPHNSTIEDLKTNIGLLRSLIRTPKLKFKSFLAGAKSRREIVYGYLSDAVNVEDLKLFEERIKKVKEHEILETTYLEEWVEESIYSPFPQVRYTERPDVATAALLRGKIIALVQGSPTIMICPGLFVEYFTTSEDYYQRTLFSSMIRWLRFIAFMFALTLPSLYIALTTFHAELIPTVLLLAILDTREKIPFPAFVEALLMEFFFELLREAGIRLPRPIGSAVSIVGALVIGQAAIQANIASPIMVIVVALTGIASFAMPQYNMAIALRILRFPLMMLAATLGGFGLMIGYFLIFLHMSKLKSLSQPYLLLLEPLETRRLFRDVLLRSPLKVLLKRSSSNRRTN
ncbi:MAG: spore gernimation protein [Paenibacillus sp.]|nr:spore gernimation protein [Paenibacillus sp.]